jgi:hypothetical protein
MGREGDGSQLDATLRPGPRINAFAAAGPGAGGADPSPASVGATSRIPGDEGLAARQLRFRRALNVAYAMWVGFIAMDWIVVRTLGAPSFGHMLACRAAVLVAVLPVLIRIHRTPPPSLGWLSALDLVAYVSPAAGIAVMCAEFGGLASPYAPGICLVLLARAVTAQDHWRRGVVLSSAPVVAFYAVLLGSSLYLPSVASQLRDRAALTMLALSSAYIFGTYLFQVVGGHVVWSLRRQVFEARELGRYRLTRRLAAGSMGEVWIAHHPGLKRDVAIKILSLRDGGDSAAAVRRFEREARAMSELSHPNTVRVFDYGATEDGLCYYVMEFLEGETVAARVERLGPVAPARALRIARQAARALGEAHERGIVHRDVAPRNIFLTSLGGEIDVVKVLDFGIAKFDSMGDAAITRSGVLLGTPEYISPEVAQGNPADARADVYGLGAVLYFLLTGTAPFAVTTVLGALRAHAEAIPATPSERAGRRFPPDLEEIVMQCLAKDPMARMPDGSALAAALLACEESTAGASLVSSQAPSPPVSTAPEEVTSTGPIESGEKARSPVAESVSGMASRPGRQRG